MDAPGTAIRVERDIPFARAGVGAGQTVLAFDAYLPDPLPARPAPAVVLAFGGAFHRGSKEDDAFPGAGDTGTNTPMAGYARRFAEDGVVGISTRYRLATEDPEPGFTAVLTRPDSVPLSRIAEVRRIMGLPPIEAAGMARAMEAAFDDVAAAAAGARANAARFRADPGRIVLGGWSAGARAALYAAYAERAPCAGVIALSGGMQPEDAALHVRPGVAHPPLLMIVAERDLGYVRGLCDATAAAARAAGAEVRVLNVPGADHWYDGEAMTNAGVTVWAAMRDAVRRWTAPDALLNAFADSYNRHDLDALLGMVTEDCVFDMSAGPDPWGARHAGKAALREALPWAWHHWPDARWEDATHVVSGDRGFSEWTFRGTDREGRRTEVRGVDLFVLRDGLIARKDTFRKAPAAG